MFLQAGGQRAGNYAANVSVTGSLSAINTSLNGMTFTPPANFAGRVTASPGPLTAARTIAITVSCANDPPVAVDDTYTVTGGSPSVSAPGVLSNDTDVDAPFGSLTVLLITGPQYAAAGGFMLSSNGSFTYTHDGGGATVDSFTYKTAAPTRTSGRCC